MFKKSTTGKKRVERELKIFPKILLNKNFTGLIFNSINVPFIRFVEFKFLNWERRERERG